MEKKINNIKLRTLLKEEKCNRRKMLKRYDSSRHIDESQTSAPYIIQTDDDSMDNKKFNNIKSFMNFSLNKLGIKNPLKITMTKDRDLYGLKTLAQFDIGDSHAIIYSNNRHTVDIIRSIAHELVHKNQFDNGKYEMGEEIQDIGGPIEDEANAVAGQIVKEFSYKTPEIFE